MNTKIDIIVLLAIILCAGCQTVSPKVEVEVKKKPVQTIKSTPLKKRPAGQLKLIARKMSFDQNTGMIKYSLPEKALIRIRIGGKDGGALFDNMVDWEVREAGEHEEQWDRKDPTGEVTFSPRDELMAVILSLPMDKNECTENPFTRIGCRKSPGFSVSFPQAESIMLKEKEFPVLKGITPVRIVLDEKDAQWLTETQYEIALFVDNVFLMDEERGVNPYTYFLNTAGMSDGIHKITANVIGYEGEMGTRSTYFYISNK